MTPSAPLWQRLQRYAGERPARFHMPGHKGVLPPPFDACAPYDVTELAQSADLYGDAQGVIRDSERRMAALYGAQDCLYLTGGATQALYTALAALTQPGDTIQVDRHSHRSVYHAMGLLDLRPRYLRRDVIGCFGVPGDFTHKPSENGTICYTVENYYGVLTIVPPQEGQYQICDMAHGGALPFLRPDYTLPGTLCAVSAHKTLAALGQSAFLLSDGTVAHERLRHWASVLGSSSPSFLLLASMDLAQAALHGGAADEWQRVAAFSESVKQGFANVLSGRHTALPLDPAKLCVYTGDGEADAERLAREHGVVCEMADRRCMVFMLSPQNTEEDFDRLLRGLETLPRRADPPALPDCPEPTQAATPREALFGRQKTLPLAQAAGCIAAQVLGPYPPGVPWIAPGEKIDKIHVEILGTLCYTQDTLIQVLT